jgi:hypothetical protein
MKSSVAIVILASELPDPGQLSFAPILGAVGFFVSGLLARLRGVSDEERTRSADRGTWVGIGIGLAVWLLGFPIHAL